MMGRQMVLCPSGYVLGSHCYFRQINQPWKVVILAALLDCFGYVWVFFIFTMVVVNEFTTSCWGSSTCRYFTFPVSPKYCLYSSPSLTMLWSSWAKYFAALGSPLRSLVSHGSFNILSLRFPRTGS